jgi:hypothetical protein
MTDKEILEGNKLIKKFVGGDCMGILETGGNPLRAYYPPENIEVFEAKGYITQLHYDQSWDALMPVVEKIEGMGYYSEIRRIVETEYPGNDKNHQVVSFSNSISEITYLKTEGSKIETVWKAVILFIQWYNNQTPQP